MTGGRILLVEDNEATRYVVSRILTNAGYTVTAAGTGEEGLALAASVHPDLVLLDVKLPDVSGFEIVARLKRDPRTAALPLVHLSATSISTAERVRGLEGGADAYLTHPIEPRVLVATLDALLRARRAEARYRKIFDTGLLGIVAWDKEGTLTDANETFLRLVGHDRAELAGRRLRWDDLVLDGRDTPTTPPATDGPLEVTLLARDGTPVPALVGRAPNGDSDDAVAFVLDITERKRAEEAVRDADRRKDEFLAVLSHELRNPLAPIRNAIALLARVPPEGRQATRAREILERQTQHLTRLVDDLLDVTRIGRGKVVLQRARLDLRDVVRKTTDDVRSIFEEARVELRVEHPAGPVWIDADETRVSQVVSNLLQNAAKFTPAGGTVSVVVRGGELAEVSVRDDGIGLSPAERAHLFEPFAQADRSLARTKGGLGLGLALVRGLVELHGGSVTARSEGVGRGTEFTITLPVATGEAPPAEPVAAAPARPARVLIVEDNADAASTLADLLELEGHQVWIAPDGTTGIARAQELRPDLVLCDLGLPDADGYAVARALRADRQLPPIRLVALSGYAQPEDRQRALDAGFDEHVAKPPSLELIERIISTLP
jgi:signal transduction histidine kinase